MANKKYLFLFIPIAVLILIFSIFYFKKDNYNYENLEITPTKNVISNTTTVNPDFSSTETIKIHIYGQVNFNGVLELNVDSRVCDAIDKAGGLTPNADINKINLASFVEDGQKLYIPSINDKEIPQEFSNTSNINSKININTASESQLQEIPGVGPSTAEDIILYRKEKGKFSKIEDIKNVTGIGESKFNKMKDKIKTK